jgi:predicted nucleic-acid-binding Zn-ribbon protein
MGEVNFDVDVVCLGCGYKGKTETFDSCLSPYHDLRCPKCGTTNLDTSELGKQEGYGYGNGNTLSRKP